MPTNWKDGARAILEGSESGTTGRRVLRLKRQRPLNLGDYKQLLDARIGATRGNLAKRT
jgi:hypothetical protein